MHTGNARRQCTQARGHATAAPGTDLNLLVALRALLEEANVTRAGTRIHMGQSSMSAALAKLRQQFDDELLVRVGRDYELTPLARQLLPQVQLTLPLVEQALGHEHVFDPAVSHRAFTMLLTDYAAVELKPWLVSVIEDAPNVRLDLRHLPAAPTDSDHDLLDNDFIVAVPGIGIEGESVELFRDEYVCLVDRHNPAVAEGRIGLEDFLRLPHADWNFGRAHVTPAERRIRELGLVFETRVTTASFLALPSIVAGTDLVAVVPSRLVEHTGPQTGTVAVPTPFAPVELIEWLWWHPSRTHDPGHAWFRHSLLEAMRASR
ncbi:MAG: LysR family transcriptional regulator [Microbacteriaceae bacterium]